MEGRLLFRVPEVAVILNINRSTVYELLGSGDLPSVKIDRTRLVRGSDLRAIRRVASPCGLSGPWRPAKWAAGCSQLVPRVPERRSAMREKASMFFLSLSGSV